MDVLSLKSLEVMTVMSQKGTGHFNQEAPLLQIRSVTSAKINVYAILLLLLRYFFE